MQYDSDTRYVFNRFAPNYLATAGVMYFAEEHKCHWLLDVIASYAHDLKKKNADYFKICEMSVDTSKHSGTFIIRDEINGVLVKQEIEFTDLDQSVTFWLVTEGDKEILLLPSEY